MSVVTYTLVISPSVSSIPAGTNSFQFHATKVGSDTSSVDVTGIANWSTTIPGAKISAGLLSGFQGQYGPFHIRAQVADPLQTETGAILTTEAGVELDTEQGIGFELDFVEQGIFPASTLLPAIWNIIQTGKGIEASILGQNYNVYRLNSTSTGQLVQPSNLVQVNYPSVFERTTKLADIEANIVVKVPIFFGDCDARLLQVGDVLVEVGPPGLTDGGAFTFVYDRPLNANVFVQTPLPCQISRVITDPTKVDRGIVPTKATMKAFEIPLSLTNGFYGFVPKGTPAAVYMGIQPESRRGRDPGPATLRKPTDVPIQEWYAFFANLPGYECTEGDIVTGGNGDRYRVIAPAFQTIGFQGTQAKMERLLT